MSLGHASEESSVTTQAFHFYQQLFVFRPGITKLFQQRIVVYVYGIVIWGIFKHFQDQTETIKSNYIAANPGVPW